MDDFNFNTGVDNQGGQATGGSSLGNMSFDLSSVDENKTMEFPVLAAGTYDAMVDEFTFKESKKGAPMIEVKYNVLGQASDHFIYDYMVLGGNSEKAIEMGQARLKKFLVRVCPEANLTAFNPATFAAEGVAVAKRCRLTVKIVNGKGDYAGTKQNRITDILSADTGSFL